MKIKLYALHNYPVAVESVLSNKGLPQHIIEDIDFPVGAAYERGWQLLCPYSFTATWNGGSSSKDIAISAPGFVTSQKGYGIITLDTGYLFKVVGDYSLWVRGPADIAKDGLIPMEAIFDAGGLACPVTMQWKFTQPNQTIRFEKGEPFCTITPYPKGDFGEIEIETDQIADHPDVYQEYQEWLGQQSTLLAAKELGLNPNQIKPISKQKRYRKDLPAVSCVCLTYGRPHLLEEAIYSFLQQDYKGQKELIVLNDLDLQTLEFDHPEVKIINIPKRFRTVGEKINAAIAFCAHDVVFVWDDDDIYLPHRISFSIENYNSKSGFFKADKAFFWNNGQLTSIAKNIFHSGACYSRALFNNVRGYPALNTGFDQALEKLFEQQKPDSTRPYPVKPEQIYYIYRWAGSDSYHLSGSGTAQLEVYEKVKIYVEEQIKQGHLKQGRIQLNPRWQTDYLKLVRAALPTIQEETNKTSLPDTATDPDEDTPPPFPPPLPRRLTQTQEDALFSGSHPKKISVILPALNEGLYLQRTVDQFLQTLPSNSEIIVVDNGSTDNSADFFANEQHYPSETNPVVTRLVKIKEPLGVAGARNRGLNEAAGEVVVFADAHMDTPKNWWQPLIEVLNRPGAGIAAPGITAMNHPEVPKACGQRVAESNLRTEWLQEQQDAAYPVPTLGGGFMVMRQDTLNTAGSFDEGMLEWGSEDLEICLRYWLLGYEIWMVPEVAIPHKFRKERPYDITWETIPYNILRTAFLHFNQERTARVIDAVRNYPKFGLAMAMCAQSNVWQERTNLLTRRKYDDNWYFERFANMNCYA